MLYMACQQRLSTYLPVKLQFLIVTQSFTTRMSNQDIFEEIKGSISIFCTNKYIFHKELIPSSDNLLWEKKGYLNMTLILSAFNLVNKQTKNSIMFCFLPGGFQDTLSLGVGPPQKEILRSRSDFNRRRMTKCVFVQYYVLNIKDPLTKLSYSWIGLASLFKYKYLLRSNNK